MKSGKMVVYDDLQQDLLRLDTTPEIHKMLIMSNYIEGLSKGKCIGRLKYGYKGLKTNTVILIDYRKIIEFFVLSIFELDSISGKFDAKATHVSRDIKFLREYIEMIPFKDDQHFLVTEKGEKGDPRLFEGIKLIR